MGLVDPVKIYAGTSNVQAQMICRLLLAAGVEAFAFQDMSPAGVWMGGTIPGIFDAGVYVSRVDAERAVTLISEQELLDAERSRARGAEVAGTCEECGKTAAFPGAQAGTVQSCPHCGAFLDVDEENLPDSLRGESEVAEDDQ